MDMDEKFTENKSRSLYENCLELLDGKSSKTKFSGFFHESVSEKIKELCSKACARWGKRFTDIFVNQFEDLKGEEKHYALRHAIHHLTQVGKPQDFFKLGRTEGFLENLRDFDEARAINFLEKGWQAYQKLILKKITERWPGKRHFLLEVDEMEEERAQKLALRIAIEQSDCICRFEGNQCVSHGLNFFLDEKLAEQFTLESLPEKLAALEGHAKSPERVVLIPDLRAGPSKVWEELSKYDWICVVGVCHSRTVSGEEAYRFAEKLGLTKEATECLAFPHFESSEFLLPEEEAEAAWFMLEQSELRESLWASTEKWSLLDEKQTLEKLEKDELMENSRIVGLVYNLLFAWESRSSQNPSDEEKLRYETALSALDQFHKDIQMRDIVEPPISFWHDSFQKELKDGKESSVPYAKVEEGAILRKSLHELRAELDARGYKTDDDLLYQLPVLLAPFLRGGFFDELLVRYDEITGKKAINAKGEEEERSVLDRYCHELGHNAHPFGFFGKSR